MKPGISFKTSQQITALITDIIDVRYPALFQQLNHISNIIIDNCEGVDMTLLKTILENINKSLDELYRKSKLVFFPFVKKRLQEKPALAIHTNAFEWIAGYHQEVTASVRRSRECIGRLMIDENQTCLQEINATINQFESDFIIIRLMTEEKILPGIESSPFKKM